MSGAGTPSRVTVTARSVDGTVVVVATVVVVVEGAVDVVEATSGPEPHAAIVTHAAATATAERPFIHYSPGASVYAYPERDRLR